MKHWWKRTAWVVLAVLLWVGPAGAQTTTTVSDTIYRADGQPAQGSVVVSWNAFTAADGTSIPAGSTTATLGSGGSLTLALTPNAGSTPMGSYYTAVFHLNDGTVSKEYWVIPVVVPGGGPAKLAAIRNEVLPTAVAMRTVSKQYVDNLVAQAQIGEVSPESSPYVAKSGDTMSGPLSLPGDPATAMQAADKHYVDTNVTAVASGMAGKVAMLPSTTQVINQPAATQLEINRLNGELNAQGFIATTGDEGVHEAMQSSDCSSGCTVNIEPTYTGQDSSDLSLVTAPTHVNDMRGGAEFHEFLNPSPVVSFSTAGETINTVVTLPEPQFAETHGGGSIGAAAQQLIMNALSGGSNQAPSAIESAPYFKTTYTVQTLDGTYRTQGQHIQQGSMMHCYSVGDCLGESLTVIASGGVRDSSDEGTKYQDVQIYEDSSVYEGTCATGCSTGSTKVNVAVTAGPGTQGDGRYLMDTNPSKTVTGGEIVDGTTGRHGIANFSGTSFPVSVFLETAAIAGSQPLNMSPGTVVLPIATSNVPTGFATSTAALPATTGVACVADEDTPPFQYENFETASYSVIDATHVQLTLNKVHASGATLAVGGLCGYGLEQKVDTVGAIRQVFPVIGSTSATSLYYVDGTIPLIGKMGYTSGYLNLSLPIASVTRTNNVATASISGPILYDLNGLTMTVRGVSDASFDGSVTVTMQGSNIFQFASNGPDTTSSGGTLAIRTGEYALYPMAEVLSVFNTATNSVDNTFTLAANTVSWESGDAIEEPHYFQQEEFPSTESIAQFQPRSPNAIQAGKNYAGTVGPGLTGWLVNNANLSTAYLGGGGTHLPPTVGLAIRGPWANSIEAMAGEQALIVAHCSLRGCNRWDSDYSLFQLDSAVSTDRLLYAPESSTVTWKLQDREYSFSPNAFTADTINVNTLHMTSGSLDGVALGETTPADVRATKLTVGDSTAYPLNIHSAGADFKDSAKLLAGLNSPSFGGFYLGYDDTRSTGVITCGNNGTVSCGIDFYNYFAGDFHRQLTISTDGLQLVSGVFHEALTTPASSSASCSAGDFTDDANFHYVCVATNTWKRVALSSF
ncbi:MAG: hypothetical protein PW735_09160 [Acidobacteriaceae bacterium]|nr:hypothetical protein [Acidobacteriaceae bacterium]